MIRGVLFDFGGVITHSCWSLETMAEIIRRTFMEEGIDLGENFDRVFCEVMEEAWGRVIRTLIEERMEDLITEAIRRIGMEPPMELVMRAIDNISEAPFCIVREDAEETLKELKKMGIKIAIVSNSPINFHERVLRKAGLMDYIDTIVVSCDVRYRKPHPEIYLIALRELGLKPEEAMFVGDVLEIDIVGALKLGMICVLMRTPEPYMREKKLPREEPADPHFVIDELKEVVTIIKKINKL